MATKNLGGLFSANVRVIGGQVVEAKLAAAAPNILAHNRMLVEAMLGEVKPNVFVNTPLGPAHFGYHGRDTLRIEIHTKGIKTIGTLRAAAQLYWRERGTRRGERARMVAHHALAGVKKFIKFYYGGMATWWRL